MNLYHVLEAIGILVSGILFYSYTYHWFLPGHPQRRRSTRGIVGYRGRRYEVVMYRDATERLATEAALREAAGLRSVNLLAQAAAHEINNPLAVIIGYGEMLAGRLPPGSQEARWARLCREAATRIQEAVWRLSRIVRIESTKPTGGVPPILDTEKSSTSAAGGPDGDR